MIGAFRRRCSSFFATASAHGGDDFGWSSSALGRPIRGRRGGTAVANQRPRHRTRANSERASSPTAREGTNQPSEDSRTGRERKRERKRERERERKKKRPKKKNGVSSPWSVVVITMIIISFLLFFLYFLFISFFLSDTYLVFVVLVFFCVFFFLLHTLKKP